MHRPAFQSRADSGCTQAQLAVAELGRAPRTPIPKPRPFPTTFPKSRQLPVRRGQGALPQPAVAPGQPPAGLRGHRAPRGAASRFLASRCQDPRPRWESQLWQLLALRTRGGLIAISVPPSPAPLFYDGLFSSCVNARAGGVLPERAFVPLRSLATTKRARFAPLIMDNGKSVSIYTVKAASAPSLTVPPGLCPRGAPGRQTCPGVPGGILYPTRRAVCQGDLKMCVSYKQGDL